METQRIGGLGRTQREHARDIVTHVHHALEDKGYDTVTQIVGYILSGDPTYITGHLNARSTITRLERDELLEEIVRFYLANGDV